MPTVDEIIRSLPREVKQRLMAQGLAASQDERRAAAALPADGHVVDDEGSRLVRLEGGRGASALTYRLSADDLAL